MVIQVKEKKMPHRGNIEVSDMASGSGSHHRGGPVGSGNIDKVPLPDEGMYVYLHI